MRTNAWFYNIFMYLYYKNILEYAHILVNSGRFMIFHIEGYSIKASEFYCALMKKFFFRLFRNPHNKWHEYWMQSGEFMSSNFKYRGIVISQGQFLAWQWRMAGMFFGQDEASLEEN